MKKTYLFYIIILISNLLTHCKEKQPTNHSQSENKAKTVEVNPIETKLIKKWQFVYNQEKAEQLSSNKFSEYEKQEIRNKYEKEKGCQLILKEGGKGEIIDYDKKNLPLTWSLEYNNKYISLKIKNSETKYEIVNISDNEFEWVYKGYKQGFKAIP